MFILQDVGQTNRKGKPMYLHCVNTIGPAYTDDIQKAERFKTRDEAWASPACRHAFCNFEPFHESNPYLPF